MSEYEAVYFVGDDQAINRVRIDSSKTRNRGAFSGSLAALFLTTVFICINVPGRCIFKRGGGCVCVCVCVCVRVCVSYKTINS